MMTKTLVYLERSQLKALKGLSRRWSRPVAHFLREAVDYYLKEREEQPSLNGIIGIGTGKKSDNTSEIADDILKQHFRGRS